MIVFQYRHWPLPDITRRPGSLDVPVVDEEVSSETRCTNGTGDNTMADKDSAAV